MSESHVETHCRGNMWTLPDWFGEIQLIQSLIELERDFGETLPGKTTPH